MPPAHRASPSRVILELLPTSCSWAARCSGSGSPFPAAPFVERGGQCLLGRGAPGLSSFSQLGTATGERCSVRVRPAPSPPCVARTLSLKEEHDEDGRKSSVSLTALQHLNKQNLSSAEVSKHLFSNEEFLHARTQNYSPAFQKPSPSSLLSAVNCNVLAQRK